MKFAHLADCHIGSWREPKLRDVSTKAFVKAVDMCIDKQVDFVLVAGDLFNTSLPAIDKLKMTVSKLKQLKQNGIPVYIVPGSHDFSPSGKTMLEVLEEADLLINVVKGEVNDNKLRLKFTVDSKTGAKITGMLGKRGMLEKSYYESLDKENLESEEGFKIFMFHTALTELKPKELEKMASSPISLLPKNFDYYAGGHVHIIEKADLEGYKNVVYPGPLFPNSFSELEKLRRGGFYLFDNGSITYEPVEIARTESISLKVDHLTPEQAEEQLKREVSERDFINAIVTIRMTGSLESGRVSDINFRDIFDVIYGKSAYFVMKNTNALRTKDLEQIKINTSNVDDIESDIIKEHLQQIKVSEMDGGKEEHLTKQLMQLLSSDRDEGEKVHDFEDRVKEQVKQILDV
ncbi:exonuclease SbcCD subunit D [Nanoarchaeota archaeon]